MGSHFLVILGRSSRFPLPRINHRFRFFSYRLHLNAVHLLRNPRPVADAPEASPSTSWPVLSWELGMVGERFATGMDWVHSDLL